MFLEAVGINLFRAIVDKLYDLYKQSPKNLRELQKAAVAVGEEVVKIG